jgi:hypothetical protein
MTDLSIVRRSTKSFRVSIVDEVGAAIDITDAVFKFAVKRSSSDSNTNAIIFKASYDGEEVDIDSPATGQLLVHLLPEDTYSRTAGTFCWDAELTRRDGLKSSAGSIAVTPGSGIIVGTGLDFSAARVGNILVPAGVTAPNQVQVTILDVGGSGLDTDPGVGNLLTDYTDWDLESGITIQIYKGNSRTPVGLSGTFSIVSDVAN